MGERGMNTSDIPTFLDVENFSRPQTDEQRNARGRGNNSKPHLFPRVRFANAVIDPSADYLIKDLLYVGSFAVVYGPPGCGNPSRRLCLGPIGGLLKPEGRRARAAIRRARTGRSFAAGRALRLRSRLRPARPHSGARARRVAETAGCAM